MTDVALTLTRTASWRGKVGHMLLENSLTGGIRHYVDLQMG